MNLSKGKKTTTATMLRHCWNWVVLSFLSQVSHLQIQMNQRSIFSPSHPFELQCMQKTANGSTSPLWFTGTFSMYLLLNPITVLQSCFSFPSMGRGNRNWIRSPPPRWLQWRSTDTPISVQKEDSLSPSRQAQSLAWPVWVWPCFSWSPCPSTWSRS